MHNDIVTWVHKFNNTNIVVIGDLMLDEYLIGDSTRLSPEAPVPVVQVKSTKLALGGAGNVLSNIHEFGGSVNINSVIGGDESGRRLINMLLNKGVSVDGIYVDQNSVTTRKSRVMVGGHQVVRFDHEESNSIEVVIEQSLLTSLSVANSARKVDLVIVSDYAKGVVTSSLMFKLTKYCTENLIPIIVDPKGVSFEKYSGVTVITPNLIEAQLATGMMITDHSSLKRVCEKLIEITHAKHIVLTLGEGGIALYSQNGLFHIFAADARQVYDVTGAGDTVVAILSLAYSIGLSIKECVKIANTAAGLVVEKAGTSTIGINELIARVNEMYPNSICENYS